MDCHSFALPTRSRQYCLTAFDINALYVGKGMWRGSVSATNGLIGGARVKSMLTTLCLHVAGKTAEEIPLVFGIEVRLSSTILLDLNVAPGSSLVT